MYTLEYPTCLRFGKTFHGCLVLLKSFLQVVAREVWLAHVVVDTTHIVVVKYWGTLPQVSANTQALIRIHYHLSVKQNKISLLPPWFLDYVTIFSLLYTSTSGMAKHGH
jgi:hypothetical protein